MAVLESKLRFPRTLGSPVRRHHLLSQMAADADRGIAVTAVTAPAGSGKTLLLAQRGRQLESQGVPVAWLSVDQYDNDSRTLWSGILTASARAVSDHHGQVEKSLSALQPPRDTPDPGFLGAFYQALGTLPRGLWLILDDVHEIFAEAALAGIARLIKSPPPALRLLLGCRYDPPLPLPRMLLEGSASQIRAADLAFDHNEARLLLSAHDLQLSDADLDMLLARTEGWAAGLKLAALSLERQDDVSELIAALAGDDHPVADYLVSEVLASQPAATVDFLLATAIPERLTPDMATELSGRVDAGAILDQLVQQNVLVVQSEGFPRTYRYHSLLRGYLIAEMDRRDAGAVRELHRKASEWYIRHGNPSLALEHAVHAQDWHRVAGLVASDGLQLLLEGDIWVARAVEAAPEPVTSQPVIALTAAMGSLLQGELSAATLRLDTVGRDPLIHRDARLRLLHTTALLYEARLRADRSPQIVTLVELARRAAIDDRDLELLAAAARGMTSIELGDFATADADLSAAYDLAYRQGRHFLALDCLSHLALSASMMSNFGEMVARAERAIEFAAERGWQSSGPMVATHVIAGWGAWQSMDVARAKLHGSLAVAIEADVEPKVRVAAELLGVHVDFVENRDALEAHERLRAIWARPGASLLAPKEACSFCLLELRIALLSTHDTWVDDVLARAQLLLGQTGDVDVLYAMAHAHGGKHSIARRLLAPIVSAEKSCHGVNSVITAWLLEAHLAATDGDSGRAHDAVRQAIELAAPRRTLRLVVETSSAQVRDLLVAGRAGFGAHGGFVTDVVTAMEGTEPKHAFLAGEALTARELELLRDLPSLLSLGEIARARVVSVNTVKSHLKALYRKLDVSSRRDAVERARELGLL